jgi:dihydrofolate reductase
VRRVRVYLATSLDGRLAGPGDDLSWLPTDLDLGEHGFAPFLAEVGAVLMGRRTFDVVHAMGDAWPYGDRPVLVATHRPLPDDLPNGADARAVSGTIADLVDQASVLAGARDVYLDGGSMVRQALEAGVALHLTLTVVPVLLGAGPSLFGDPGPRRALTCRDATMLPGGLVQLRYEAATLPGELDEDRA